MIELIHGDCMDYLKGCKENQFDLAIVDPPFGIGMDGNKNWSGSKHEIKNWDSDAPSSDYFRHLIRSNKNQIIWGANHFISKIPFNSPCWIVWDKKNDGFSFADGEMAWTSFDTAMRFFRYHRGQQTDDRIHPTQKPVALYRWLLQHYAKKGETILDTHGGSMSIAIACYIEGFDLVCIEKDKDYYDAAKKRYEDYVSMNPQMFEPEDLRPEIKQGELF